MFRRNFRFLASPSSSSLDIKAAFKILGLNPAASSATTPEHARQQYLKLARQYHPDVSNGDDTKMKQVNLAYEVVQHYASTTGGNFSSIGGAQQQQKRKSKHDMSAAERAEAENNNKNSDDDGFDSDHDDNFGRGDSSASWREKRQQKKNRTNNANRKSNLSDASTWNSRPEFEWNEAIFNVNDAEASNPRNHPNTFNRHFSFNDDSNIFRATRSGATVEEIARSMGRSAFAIEARMNSTQFKLRIQKMLKSSNYQRKHGIDQATTSNNINDDFNINNNSDTGSNENEIQHQDVFANGRKRGQRMSAKTESKFDFSRQVHPFRDTVYRNPVPKNGNKNNNSAPPQPGDLPFMHPEEIEEAFANDGRYVDEAEDDGDESDNTFNQFSSKRIQSAHGRTYHHLMNHMKKGSKRGNNTSGRGFY